MPTLLRTAKTPLNPFTPTVTKPNKMSSQPGPSLLPYRDTNNQTIAYAPAPNTLSAQRSPYDSDFEPLISAPSNAEELDEDAILRFTATGRPMPGFKASGLQNMGGGDMFTLPQLLPRRYTDDSLIPAIIVDVVPSQKTLEEERKRAGKGVFMKKLKGEPRKEEGKGLTKVVYMPRRDYLKWFARDSEGKYIGTEPYRTWGEEELEETFKQYQPVVEKKGLGLIHRGAR